MARVVLLLGFFALALPTWACWEQAASRYQVDPALLYAIARTESGVNLAAWHRNRDGSFDIGLMQINSAWFPTLAHYAEYLERTCGSPAPISPSAPGCSRRT